jgi:hypothetical protein
VIDANQLFGWVSCPATGFVALHAGEDRSALTMEWVLAPRVLPE